MTTRVQKHVLFAGAIMVLAAAAIGRPTVKDTRSAPKADRADEAISIEARLADAEANLALFDVSGDLAHVVHAESAAYHALEIDNRHVGALNVMSKALLIEGRFDDVVYVQNWSIVVDIENPESWGILGDAFMRLGKYRSADSCYGQMELLDDDFEVVVRLAERAFEFGEIESASEMLYTVHGGKDPGLPDRELAGAMELLSRVLLAGGQVTDAFDAADAATQVIPGHVRAIKMKARALKLQGKHAAARKLLARAIEEARKYNGVSDDGIPGGLLPELEAELARVYRDDRWRHRSRPLAKKVASEFERLYARYPDAVRRDYALFLLEWNIDSNKALALALEESRRRKDVRTYRCLALAYLANGMTDEAWSAIGFALRKGTRLPEILFDAAVIAKANGKTERYESFVDRLRTINPEYERVYGSP